jgi:hypothetical protein
MKLDREPIERALDHHAAIGTIQRWSTTPDRHHLVTLIAGGTVTLRTLAESQALCAGLGTAARAAGITRERPASWHYEAATEPAEAPRCPECNALTDEPHREWCAAERDRQAAASAARLARYARGDVHYRLQG